MFSGIFHTSTDTIRAMKVHIISVGKAASRSIEDICQQYEKRLSPYMDLRHTLIPPSSKDGNEARDLESTAIVKVIKTNDVVVLLDERGIQQTNVIFANTLESLSGRQGMLTFVIGGAFGVSDELHSRADFVWSLSALVFPHQLVRVMLFEQLYRTKMVQLGHLYHHQ